MPEYLELFVDIAPAIKRGLESEVIFVSTQKTERRIRQRIEGTMVNHIKTQPGPGSYIFPFDVRYHRRRKDEKPLYVTIQCDCLIHGIPHKLEA